MDLFYYFPLKIFVIILTKYVLCDPECSLGEKPCGMFCYNPEFEQCFSGPDPTICTKAESLCGGNETSIHNCYNPSTEECHIVKSTGHVCFKGQRMCENSVFSQCYNPSIENCIHSSDPSDFAPVVCHKGELACGLFAKCYDPSVQDCMTHDNVSMPCFKGQRLCSSSGCYSEGSVACIVVYDALHRNEPRYFHCDIGQKICGGLCYSPISEVCIGDGEDAKICHKLCNGECYNSSKYGCGKKKVIENEG